LRERLLEILGGTEQVYEISLPNEVLDTFDRHVVRKAESFGSLAKVVTEAVTAKQKVLIVCNQVKRAQELYREIQVCPDFSGVETMLIHSRFKRADRGGLEKKLVEWNDRDDACIVVSTQVVEVSLDISFDLMITACAPIDALIQRFGRVNRKRNEQTIGKYKPVYVLEPPKQQDDAQPYSPEILQRTFDVLPDGEVLREKEIQRLIDVVYPDVQVVDIDLNSSFREGRWRIKELWHHPKSALLSVLDIDSVTCVDERDRDAYEVGSYEDQVRMDIPVSYRFIFARGLDKLNTGSKPYVIPHKAYDEVLGLVPEYAKPEFYDVSMQII
jgi:CRISPR-associated endonuclease/helicase Cas3